MPAEQKENSSQKSKHYRMLRKARLAEELFGEDGDGDAPEDEVVPSLQSTAPGRDESLQSPAALNRGQESRGEDLETPPDEDPLGSDLDAELTASISRDDQSMDAGSTPLTLEDPIGADPAQDLAQAASGYDGPDPLGAALPSVDWRAELAAVTGVPALASCRTLGLCASSKDTGAAPLIAALGRWIAERAQAPTLLIEANARQSRLTRVLRGRRRGLTEIFFDRMDRDEALSSWENDPLVLLPLGRNLDRKRRKQFGERLSEGLPMLRRGYDHVVVELPAANDSALKAFPVSEAADAVLLVVDPKSSTRRQIAKAAARLRKLGVPLVGCIMDGSGPSLFGRQSRMARRLE